MSSIIYEEQIAERVMQFFPGVVAWPRGSRIYINLTHDMQGALLFPAMAVDNHAGGINHEVAHQIAALIEGSTYEPEKKPGLTYDDLVTLDE